MQVIEPLAVAAAGNDVDGARNRTRAGFGSRCAHDFDALDLLGRQVIQREAARRRLAVDQYLRVAAAHSAHARRAASAWGPLRCHARKPLENFTHGAVAETLYLVAPEYDLGRSRTPTFLCFILCATGDFDRLQGGGRLLAGSVLRYARSRRGRRRIDRWRGTLRTAWPTRHRDEQDAGQRGRQVYLHRYAGAVGGGNRHRLVAL